MDTNSKLSMQPVEEFSPSQYQNLGSFWMDKLGTQTTFNYTYFLSNIEYLSFQNVNLTSGKLLLFLLRLYYKEGVSLWFIFYSI